MAEPEPSAMFSVLRAFILQQAELLGSPEPAIAVIEPWLETRGMTLLTNIATIKGKKSVADAWEDSTVRAHITHVWIQDNHQEMVRSESLFEVPHAHVRSATPGKRSTCGDKVRSLLLLPKIPVIGWARTYNWRAELKSDVVAGVSTGINMVPKGLAFAFLANISPASGLYSAAFPAMVYFVLGTSRHLGVAPSPLVALLTAAGISRWCLDESTTPLPDVPPEEGYWVGNCSETAYSTLVFKMALTQGFVMIVMGLFKAGWLLRFFSRPLMSGFLSAAALIIALSQLHYLLFEHDVEILDSVSALTTLVSIFENIEHVHWPTVLFSLGCLVVLLIFKNIKATHSLYSLILVVLSILLSFLLTTFTPHFDVDVTGNVVVGFPKFDMSVFSLVPANQLLQWMQHAVLLAIVGFLESSSAAQIYSLRYDYSIDISQEMLAVGCGNLLGGTLGCMPTMGAVGTTAMLDAFGAQSRLAALVSALVVFLTISASVLTDLFYYLPKPALALIIISAVVGLVDIKEIMFLQRGHARDFWSVIILFICTLVVGIDGGLLFAIVFSAAAHVYRSGNTDVFEIGRVPGSDAWMTSRDKYPIYIYDDFVITGFNGALFFGNEDLFKNFICGYLRGSKASRIQLALVLDCSRISFVDGTGVHALEEVVQLFAQHGRTILFCALNDGVKHKMDACDLVQRIGLDHFFDSVPECVRHLITLQPGSRAHGNSETPLFQDFIPLESSGHDSHADSAPTETQRLVSSETQREYSDLADDPVVVEKQKCSWACCSRALCRFRFSSSPFSHYSESREGRPNAATIAAARRESSPSGMDMDSVDGVDGI